MEERQWRVLSGRPVSYGGGLLGFLPNPEEFSVGLLEDYFLPFPGDSCSYIIRVSRSCCIFPLENWTFFLFFVRGFFPQFC